MTTVTGIVYKRQHSYHPVLRPKEAVLCQVRVSFCCVTSQMPVASVSRFTSRCIMILLVETNACNKAARIASKVNEGPLPVDFE